MAPGVPVVGHLHGTELLMLEEIADGADWPHAAAWAERLRGWAGALRAADRRARQPRRAPSSCSACRERCSRCRTDSTRRSSAADVDRGAVAARAGRRAARLATGDAVWERELPAASCRRGPVILYVGRFTAVKRLPLLIEAFAALPDRTRPAADADPRRRPSGGVGGRASARHGRAAGRRRVLLAGWRAQDALPELLCAADVLALAAAREQFGQVLVEAMACGLPPVATASQGPALIVREGETGWLVPIDDRAALAEALDAALADPGERARRGAAAAHDAAERFSWPAIAGHVAGVLREAADTRPAASRRAASAS